ncbi:hypothetical protein DYB37_005798 [Aphanomyces astaci]|uniref:Peptidase C51 domain-containing protein n=1 Tax=Aphanomyces astaci TaxID=112090 RepID=A0A418FDE5_APHAT|nr:hypothetical protein DYB37_005798 [Aphanomyces astaci]
MNAPPPGPSQRPADVHLSLEQVETTCVDGDLVLCRELVYNPHIMTTLNPVVVNGIATASVSGNFSTKHRDLPGKDLPSKSTSCGLLVRHEASLHVLEATGAGIRLTPLKHKIHTMASARQNRSIIGRVLELIKGSVAPLTSAELDMVRYAFNKHDVELFLEDFAKVAAEIDDMELFKHHPTWQDAVVSSLQGNDDPTKFTAVLLVTAAQAISRRHISTEYDVTLYSSTSLVASLFEAVDLLDRVTSAALVPSVFADTADPTKELRIRPDKGSLGNEVHVLPPTTAHPDDQADMNFTMILRQSWSDVRNHAAMFVLSKNLGDVCANHIEAIQFFEYALEVATTCGVLRDPRLRSSIASIAVAMQSLDESIDTCDGCGAIDVRVLPPTTHFNGADSVLCFRCWELAHQGKDNPPENALDLSAATCATCAQTFPHHALKLDVDDQHYCHACFDAYYGDDDPTPSWDLEEDEDVSDDDGMLCAGCLRADGTLDGGNGLVYCSDCFIAIPSHDLPFVPKEVTSPTTTSNGHHCDDKPIIQAAAPLQSLESIPLRHPTLSTPSSLHAGEEIPTTAVQKYTKSFLLSLRDSAQSKVVPRGVEMSPVYILGSQQRLKGGPLRGKPTASTIIPATCVATTTATNLDEKEEHEFNAVVDTTQRSALPMPKAEFARHVLAVDEATCVELARRYLLVNFGVVFGDVDYAFQIFDLDTVVKVADGSNFALNKFVNGGSVRPERGSLLIWDPTGEMGITGHVAVVVDATDSYVDIVEQNVEDTIWPTGQRYSRRLKVKQNSTSYFVEKWYDEEHLLGWATVDLAKPVVLNSTASTLPSTSVVLSIVGISAAVVFVVLRKRRHDYALMR